MESANTNYIVDGAFQKTLSEYDFHTVCPSRENRDRGRLNWETEEGSLGEVHLTGDMTADELCTSYPSPGHHSYI